MANPPDNNEPGNGGTRKPGVPASAAAGPAKTGNPADTDPNRKPAVPASAVTGTTASNTPADSGKPAVPASATAGPANSNINLADRRNPAVPASTAAETPAPTTSSVNQGAGGLPSIEQTETPPPVPKPAVSSQPIAGAGAAAAAATASTVRATNDAPTTGPAKPVPGAASSSNVRPGSVDTSPSSPARSKFERPDAAPRTATSSATTESRMPETAPRRPAPARRPEPRRPAERAGPPRARRPERPREPQHYRRPAGPPRRRMAPPPGANRGRYIAPAARPARPGYVVPPAVAADGGSAWAPLLFGLLLLLGVLWYAIKQYAPSINADLTTRTNSALADANLNSSANVEIDGRNAVLNGSVNSQADSDRAEEVVAATEGVRSVENNLTIGDGSDAGDGDRVEPSLTFMSADNGIKLSGTVSDQEYADEIESAAKETYGEDNVTGSLTVNPNSTNPGWWPAVRQLTPDLKGIEKGSFNVFNGSLTLSGIAADEQVKNDLGAKAAELVQGQLTVDNRITVAAPPPPPPAPLKPSNATLINNADNIIVSGNMPAESVRALEAAFGSASKPVTSSLVASDEFEAPAWADGFGASLDALKDINDGKLEVLASGEITISGIAASEEAKQDAADKIAEAFEGLDFNNQIVVVVPEPEPVQPFMNAFATLTDNGREVTITGLLPAVTADAVTSALRDTGKTVTSNVTVDERVIEPDWTSALSSALDQMNRIENAKVAISSTGELTVSGVADNDNDRQQAGQNTFSIFGDSVSLRNDITVKGPDITQLIAQIDLAAIRFRTNSSELDADSVNILDQVADALQQVPSATIEIEGHTDSTGNNERNIVLSGERADRVRTFLINRGIGGDRMTSRGYGSSQPIASNDTVTGRALNRRIELVLTNGE